jgi:aspartyl-tRNA(Asn)/glutamyl-tRNA(Gln) amidotransferase subunit B
MGDLFASLNEKNISISKSLVTAKTMSNLINAISSGSISGRTAKEVFEIMKETGDDPKKIIENKSLQQESNPKKLKEIIDKVLDENQNKVEQFKSGKDKLFGFFVGQVMKVSGGKANPQLVNDILKKSLK